MEIKYYYSDEFRKDMIELSDNRIWWDINKYNYDKNDIADSFMDWVCGKFAEIFNAHYHTQVRFCGRSGRHVCVDDTAANRRNYAYMCDAVDMMQRLVVYNATRNEEYFNTHVTALPRWLAKACKDEFRYIGKRVAEMG